MKDFQVFLSKKYKLILIYFNFIIILNLIIRLVQSSQTSSSQKSSQQSDEQSENNSQFNDDSSIDTCNRFCWGGYLAVLLFLNSVFIINCKLKQEKWYFWIKQSFLAITLLLVIIVMNLSTNYQVKFDSSCSIYQNQQRCDYRNLLYFQIKYQMGQVSLFLLISLIEVLPFQIILICINQIYFIFIRMEIYSKHYSDQIIFFGVYFSSIGILIGIQRFQLRTLDEVISSTISTKFQSSNLKVNQKNLSNQYMGIQSQPLQIAQTNRSCPQNQQDTGYANELKGQEGSYTLCQNLQNKDTQNPMSSRPLSYRNLQGRDYMSQFNDSTNNITKKDFEDPENVCQSSIAAYGARGLNEMQLFYSKNSYNTNKEQFFKGILMRKQSNSIDNYKEKILNGYLYYDQEKEQFNSSECILAQRVNQNGRKAEKQRETIINQNMINQYNLNQIKNKQNQSQEGLQHDCSSVGNMTFNKSNCQLDFNINSTFYQQQERKKFINKEEQDQLTSIKSNQFNENSSKEKENYQKQNEINISNLIYGQLDRNNSSDSNRSNSDLSPDPTKKPSIFLKKCKSMDNQIPIQHKLSKYSKMEQVNEEQTTKQSIENEKSSNPLAQSMKDSEFPLKPQISHRNLSIIYQVFFNYFPEGKLLLDSKDNAQLKEAIFTLPNLKAEIDQAQQQGVDSQFDSRNKVSFESFRNLNMASTNSATDQMFNQNYQNNSNITNTNHTLTTNNSVLNNEKINRSRYSINEEQTPKKVYPKFQSLLGGGMTSPYQRANQLGDNFNSFQTIKLERIVSNQVNLQAEIQKNLFKTQQFIHQHNMESIDSNMILNETIIINSKFKKNNINNCQANQQQHQSNLNFQNTSINQIYYTANSNNQNNSQQSIKNQVANQNQIGSSNQGNNGQSPSTSYQTNYNQKERNTSFQFGAIANSIYGSTFMSTANNHNNSNNLNSQMSNFQNTSNVNILINSNNINQSVQYGSNVNTPTNVNISCYSPQLPQLNQHRKRKSSILFTNTVNGGGTATGIAPGSAQNNFQNQYNPSFMNFQASQQYIDKGNQHQQENIYDYRELEISLFPSVVEGRAMMLLMIRDVTHRKYIQHLKMANLHKQQIVSYLSHELRNPLNCIINMLDTVEYDIQGLKKVLRNQSSIEEIENNVATALQNSKYILNLSNDYLDMARIKADQFKLNIQPFNLLSILKDCMKLFTIQAYKVNTQIILKNRSLKNTFYCDPTSQFQNMIYSDPERIKQVVINLISNALKFTHNGRIFIRAEYSSISSVKISIRDTGIGIEQKKVKELFKAFGKIEDEETQNYNQQGVGLGLLISNMLSIQLSKPPAFDTQNAYNNNQVNATSLMNLNISNQTIPLSSQQNQQIIKQERGLKAESEKGIGSTFTLTVTDHNPYYRQNKNLAKQAIQQIAETQESSAFLSQSLYENPLTKKSQFEKELSNQSNQKISILGTIKNHKKSSQLIPQSQSQINILQTSTSKSYNNLKKERKDQLERSKSSIILDSNNPNAKNVLRINLSHVKSSASFTQISLSDFSEQANEQQSQFIISKSPCNQVSPLTIIHKNNNNLNFAQPCSPSTTKQRIHFTKEKISPQLEIESSPDIKSQLANNVKFYPQIKNKFINSINIPKSPSIPRNVSPYLTPLSIPNRKSSNQLKSPNSSPFSPLNQALRTSKYNKQQQALSRQNISLCEEEILIVDDNIFCCEALKNIIQKRFGIGCMICFSAMKAVEAVKEKFTNIKKNGSKEVAYHSEDLVSEISEKKKNTDISIVLQQQTKKDINSVYNISNKIVESEDNISENRFFKFIFLDINMPDVNGFEGLYQIKSFLSQVYPNFSEKCQIIGCSGIDENFLEDQQLGNNNPLSQFDNFLFKPVLKEKLIEFFATYNISMIN